MENILNTAESATAIFVIIRKEYWIYPTDRCADCYHCPQMSHCKLPRGSCARFKWASCFCLSFETLPHSSQITTAVLFLWIIWICWARPDSTTIFLQRGHSLRLCLFAKWSSSKRSVSKLSTHFATLHLNSLTLCDCLKCRFNFVNVKKCILHFLHLNWIDTWKLRPESEIIYEHKRITGMCRV